MVTEIRKPRVCVLAGNKYEYHNWRSNNAALLDVIKVYYAHNAESLRGTNYDVYFRLPGFPLRDDYEEMRDALVSCENRSQHRYV